MKSNVLESLPMFLAHSLALELDSSDRLREFSDMMARHNQPALSALFNELASLSDLHASEIEAICSGHNLPPLQPWEYEWPDLESPETSAYGVVRYDMQPREALELMLKQENGAAEFYGDIARRTLNPTIRELATEFEEEEQQHAHMLTWRLEQMDAANQSPPPAPDIDPPQQLD